ncbi:methyltransferase domain-containing protein [Nocardioides sp.]|uniref:class I SAM-dependent methyltransferase n=1 Tax=Nocardioides sp. TaxID=35761 RepID=UPI0035184901
MSEDHQRRARSFGVAAKAYHRGRPDYPDAAVRWLVEPADSAAPDEQLLVLELGAGTGKMTTTLVAHGHAVHATDPDAAMLAVLRAELPDVPTSASGAEEIPLPDRSVDVVVAAQCFHWFDPETALAEIARVLKPEGHLAVVWNERDERIPWVRKLGRIIGTQDHLRDPAAALAASALFEEVAAETFPHWQVINRTSVVDLATSRSNVLTLDDDARHALLADLLALYDDYGRGMDGMQLPYLTRCFRARVAPRPEPAAEPVPEPVAEQVPADDAPAEVGATAESASGSAPEPAAPVEDPDSTMQIKLDLAPPDRMTDSAATLPRILDDSTLGAGTVLIDLR